MNTDMTEDERFMLRAKLAQEFRRIIAEMIADETGITVRLKPALHQRIEFRLDGNAVAKMTVWSREMIHPDYPANPMRPLGHMAARYSIWRSGPDRPVQPVYGSLADINGGGAPTSGHPSTGDTSGQR